MINDDGTLVPAHDPAGNVGATISTGGGEPPVMYAAWVPEPVPTLVTTTEEAQFAGPGLEEQINLTVAGRIARVPGSPPGSRVVDVNGLLRRPGVGVTDDASRSGRTTREPWRRSGPPSASTMSSSTS